MKTVIRALAALGLGFVAGWAVSVATCFRIWDFLGVQDRDGGGAMGAFFFVGPFFGFVASILSAAYVFISALRRGTVRPVGWSPPSPKALKRRALVAAILAGMAVYLVGWAFIDLSGPWAPRSLARALFYNGIPLVIGLAAGGGVFRSLSRSAAPA